MVVSIGQASLMIGVAVSTLRRWESTGKFGCSFRTLGGHRRYKLVDIQSTFLASKTCVVRTTVGYARVSSHDQKADLERQIARLDAHCATLSANFEVMHDLGSGMNFRKKGLNQLIQKICSGAVECLVLTQNDRLLRFGSQLIFKLCEIFNTKVVVLDKAVDRPFEEELVGNVIELMTVFTARIYGKRSHKNKRAIAAVATGCEAA